jgi:hypothetical protein
MSPLPNEYKILFNILPSVLTPYVEEIVGDHQCGFRRIKSIADQIFHIGKTTKKKNEYKGAVLQLLIDFNYAYDSVRREVSYSILTSIGIPM